MNKRVAILGATILAMLVTPVFAQGLPPKPGPEAEWQQFLSRHPGLAEHPQWLNNPTYMKEHPNMAKWLEQHPRVVRDSRGEGMWDHEGNWHDSQWWHEHNPNYAQQYHPDWDKNHPDWAHFQQGSNESEWQKIHGERVEKRDARRQEWADKHPEWVEKHPEWAHKHGVEPGAPQSH
jgi:hypothetical protein